MSRGDAENMKIILDVEATLDKFVLTFLSLFDLRVSDYGGDVDAMII